MIPSSPITFHIHQRLNQVWKDMIALKLLKEQTLSYKLTVERQNIVQTSEKLSLLLDSGGMKWWGFCVFRIFGNVCESFLLFRY